MALIDEVAAKAAARIAAGGPLNGRRPVLPAPSAPMDVARELLGRMYTDDDGMVLLLHWRGGWWQWRRTNWFEQEERAIRADLYAFTERAMYADGEGKRRVWAPNRRKVADLLEALAAVCHLPDEVGQPAWLSDVVRDVRGRAHCGSDSVFVACANGLLDVRERRLLHHSPRYFNQTAVPFDYNAHAGAPSRWLSFLRDLWPNDSDSLDALQEWFGYTISGRTDLQKILLIVGPTRGGKGVISRILGSLVGRDNVAGPTLSSLRGDFGLAPLIGRPLAVISDARLTGSDSSVVVERLLSISGEDWITVNRKYREQWSGRLPCRFVICSNELPRLGDASGAIAGRFLTLLLDHSWFGREDAAVEPALEEELPGILNWALDGLSRLEERGQFTVPRSSQSVFFTLQDLASPVHAFIRQCCVTGSEFEVSVDELWRAWRDWAEDNGHGKGGNRQVFGRDLRAALPTLRVSRPRGGGGERERHYVGIALESTMERTPDIADQSGSVS